MTFISPEYVVFFGLVLPLYFFTPQRFRWLLLVLVSYLFYAFGQPQYVILILLTTAVDYTAARMIGRSQNPVQRRLFLAVSLSMNLGVLFLFKYFNFFNVSIHGLAANIGVDYAAPTVSLALPVGISFYTFQSMAYTIDVYRRKVEPEKHFGIFAAFVAFFPQLVAGPIERAGHMLPQFHVKHRFDPERAVEGLRLMLWGFFKKVVIADRLAIYVDAVYNHAHDYSGWPLILATVFFSFQIYCDFSGYTDIARGTAKIMGFDLMVNFRQPYFAPSVRDFWNRWHISLSTWFRDYLYIPLGGNRVPFPRYLLNLFIVFLVSGLWHGASWTFVIWGALHGLYIVVEAALSHFHVSLLPQKARWATLLRVVFTFALVTFAWIFFRANSLPDAQYIVAHLFSFTGQSLSAPLAEGLLGAPTEFILCWVLIGVLLLVDYGIARVGFDRLWTATPGVVRWAAYYAAGAAVILSGLYGIGAQKFIYFQF